jgi:hypothetical protein
MAKYMWAIGENVRASLRVTVKSVLRNVYQTAITSCDTGIALKIPLSAVQFRPSAPAILNQEAAVICCAG